MIESSFYEVLFFLLGKRLCVQWEGDQPKKAKGHQVGPPTSPSKLAKATVEETEKAHIEDQETSKGIRKPSKKTQSNIENWGWELRFYRKNRQQNIYDNHITEGKIKKYFHWYKQDADMGGALGAGRLF